MPTISEKPLYDSLGHCFKRLLPEELRVCRPPILSWLSFSSALRIEENIPVGLLSRIIHKVIGIQRPIAEIFEYNILATNKRDIKVYDISWLEEIADIVEAYEKYNTHADINIVLVPDNRSKKKKDNQPP